MDQLDYISIHSDATQMQLNKDATTAAVEENISPNCIIQDSKDTNTTEFLTSKRSPALKKETSTRIPEVEENFLHKELQQKSKSLEKNEIKNTQEVSHAPIIIEKCTDIETNDGNNEQTTDVKMKPLHVLHPKQMHMDKLIEKNKSDQFYLLSNILQSECIQENTECAECDFWDFAGQKEFYATHQTFLTMNAIYLLTIDLSSFETDQPVQQKGGKLDNIGGK